MNRSCTHLWGSLLAVAALGLSACGDDETVDESPPPDEPEAGPGASSTDDEAVADDGALRFAYYAGPSQGLDPHRSSQSQDTTWLAPIYEPLIVETPDSSLVPGLATEWEFTDDGNALVLTLRDGVTFHDGAAFDADVVKMNIERGKSMEGSAIAPLLDVVDEVEVVDPSTVRLDLGGPAATLPRVLADRPGMMISPEALDDPDLDSNPVGAGMYRLSDWQAGAGAVYERFDEYWNPEWNNLARLEIMEMNSSSTRFNALRSGEIDVTHLDPGQFLDAQEAEFATTEFDTTGVIFLQLNRTRAELDDVRVRQALNHAVDREAIAEAVYRSLAVPSPQFYPPSFGDGHVGELEDRFPYDPERARELLGDAGFEDGLTVEVIVPTEPIRQQVGEVLQAQFADIGVTMEIRQSEASQAGNAFYTDQIADALVAYYPGRTDPAMTAQLFFTPEAHSNPGAGTIDSVTELYHEALEVRPDEERAEILRDLMASTVEEAGNVVIVQLGALVASEPEVAGFNWSLRGQPDFRGTGVSSAG